MASFRKRGNTWEYRIRYTDRKTGKSRETSKGGFSTKAEARHAAAEAEQSLKRGYDPGTGDQTLREYFDWWFVHYKKGSVSGNTEVNITNHLGRITEDIGNVRMKDLNRPMYQQMMNRMGSKYAKSTLQRMNTTASEAFRDAIELGLLYFNPVERVKYPKTAKRSKTSKDKFLELEEVKALLMAAERKWRVEKPEYAQYLYMTYLLIGTGMRIGECCALTLDDIDLESGQVNIDKTMIYSKETLKYHVKETNQE
ncbi:tyrosine-type recombinase/integrase [Bhargavaea ginsengi]|uniref:tyrosine-type recombinase/integrase n=1 Tax=Bhargavaea ginsengi TaxID=426757 RepID=UPI000B884DBF|nr:site-specific integrase [Bhargavaea ginsengi]